MDKEAKIQAFAFKSIDFIDDYINDAEVDYHVRSALGSARMALTGLLVGIQRRDELVAADAEDEANRAEG